MECDGNKYEVEFSMKDDRIYCKGIDKVHKKSKVKCELTIDDELVLTERGIHSCILIKTDRIKINKIFNVSLSALEIEKMYKSGKDLFSTQDIKNILVNRKELHRILKRREPIKENQSEMRLRAFKNTYDILKKQYKILEKEYKLIFENSNTKDDNKITEKEYYTDVDKHRGEYLSEITEDLTEYEKQLDELNHQIDAIDKEIKKNMYNEDPVQEEHYEPEDSIVVIGKTDRGTYDMIFLNLDPTKPWNQDWRNINFWATNKELAIKHFLHEKEELENLENKYKDYKWVRSKTKSKMYRILLYQKEHKLKELESILQNEYGILENSVYYAKPHTLNIEPVDTPTRSTRHSARHSARQTRKSHSTPLRSVTRSASELYRNSVMKSINHTTQSRKPQRTRKFRFNIFNIFGRK